MSRHKHFLATFICVLLTTLLCTTVHGQHTVTGKVTDADTREPLPYATISLHNPKDSAVVTGGITAETGIFSFEAPTGVYYAVVNFVGYPPRTLDAVVLQAGRPDVDLGEIQLRAESTSLEEVVVQGKKDFIEMTLDRKIFNVSQDPINAGRTAADILGNLPSVSIDGQGNINLRGSSNVQILIDGKPSGLLSFNGSEGLRQLQGAMIDRVEIITNPSARYQAEGMAGIINIVLKKDQRRGINGSFDFTAGQPHNYGAAINLNYRRENLNFFINYGILYFEIENPHSSRYQEFYRNDTTFITQQNNISRQTSFSNNIQVGADYFFSETSILTTSFTNRHRKGTRNTDIEYADFLFNTGNPVDITRRYQDEEETEPNMEYALSYKKNFGKKDHDLSALLSYLNNWEDSDQLYTERTFLPGGAPSGNPDRLQHSDNYETEKQLLLQADYTNPFRENGKFEAGIRNTLRDITNDFIVTELNGEEWIPIEGLDNDFYYDENIYAAYAILSNKLGKASYQLGLRGEYTDLTTELLQTGEVNHREYFNLFPSAHITYDLGGKNTMQISYSRRLHRPTYNDLTPFFTFLDNRNFVSGNPDLNPEYTHAFEAGHIKHFGAGSISSAVYYRHTSDKIERIRQLDEEGFATTKPHNLLEEDAFGAEFISSFQPIEWWKTDLNLNFYRAIVDGSNLDEDFKSDTYTWFGRLTMRFTLWGNTDLQLRGNYDAPQQRPQGERLGTAYLDLSITRDVLNQKGTITLNVVDVFRSNRFRMITEGETFYTRDNFLRSPRQVILTFNYRLNQAKKPRADAEE